MAELKTKRNDADVEAFLNNVENVKRRQDAFRLLVIMEEITGLKPTMWGNSIVGFGSYHYKYASGREGDWPSVAFSPRKQSLTLYIMSGFDSFDELMSKLGKYKTGKGCLYVNKLEDVDERVLRSLIVQSIMAVKKRYG